MSSDFKLTNSTKCLEWCTELPSKDHPRESPTFFLKGNEFFIQLTYKLVFSVSYYNFFLKLKKKYADLEPDNIRFQIGFKNEDTLSLHEGEFKVSESKEFWWIKVYEFPSKLPKDYFLGNYIKVLFYFDDIDELHLNTDKEREDKCIQTVSYLNPDLSMEGLNKDFSQLLPTGLNHDVELKCGGESVKVHKIILCARSAVFKVMLESDMQERLTGVVEIKDMDDRYFQDFVRYLYTDMMPELTLDKATALYEAGDKYDIRSLMLRCSEYLRDNLSRENAFKCFELADAHSDQKLKDGIKTYTLDEKIYLEDEYWSPFCESYPKEANEVYRLSYKRISE